MELRELRLIIGRHLLVAVSVFLVCVAIGAAAALIPQKTYRTSATLVVGINAVTDGGGTTQQVTFLLPALREAAQSRSLRARAEENVPEQYRNTRPTVEAISEESVLRIRGSASSPEAAQAWVNAIADQLVEEQGSNELVDLAVLDSAPIKAAPVEPKAGPIMLASIVVGVIAGLFAALAADRIKMAFDTKQAVRDRLGTTVLGEIPLMRRRTEQRTPMIKLLSEPNPSIDLIAAFENLRTNVEFRMVEMGADRLCIVSLNRHAGKSTVAAGLSCALVKVGRQVVAIEADLRRPTLAEQLGLPSQHGLGDISASGVSDILLQPTSLRGLEVLPAGIPVGRAADVIATTLPPVMAALTQPDRTLILDSPPLRGAPESSVIVSQARHVILVVNNSNSDLEGLSDSVARINESGGVLLGIVINRVPRRRLRREVYPEFEHRVVQVDDTPPQIIVEPVSLGSESQSLGRPSPSLGAPSARADGSS